MTGHYNSLLVIVSLLIAILASWVALDLSSRIHLHTHTGRRALWLTVGSASMGVGIWSMHYVGMLAYRMDMPVLYDWPTVLVSMLAAFAASCIALRLVARKRLSWWSTVTGGSAMGAAIASMHYIGMAAMRMPVRMTYSGPLVLLSVVAAVAISMVGLRLTFGAKMVARGWSGKKAGSALLMGLAIPTMHYIGMAAAHWSSDPGRFTPSDLQHAISITTLSTFGIVMVSALVLVLALVSASIDRHVSGFESALDGSERSYAQLRQHHERLQGAFRAGGFGIWECDPATGLFYVDSHLRDLYGTPQDGLPVPRSLWKAAVHPEDVASLDQRWKECLATGDRYDNEYRIIRPDGEIRRVRSVASLVRNQDGSPKRVLGMTWDVTSDWQREQDSREQATRFRLTLQAVGDAVIATDDASHIVFMNPVASQLTDWPAETAVGRSLSDVFVTRDEGTGVGSDPVQLCIQHGGEVLSQDSMLISRNGVEYTIRKHIALMGQGRAAVITFQDITQACRLQGELLYAATHDSLTGLSNRAAFEKQLHVLWGENRESARIHCVCILDLDRFKVINDASGHIAGDALLKELAHLLQREVRASDLAARMGGDEFMLLLPDTTVEQAEPLLRELLCRISDLRFNWQGKVYHITASLGLVAFDRFSPEPDVLLSQADAAAFTAKRNGRNQIALYVEDGSAADHYNEMQIAADLRRSIEADCFELQAQPIVPAGTPQDRRYFEVLLRMRGKDGALVSPALFIPAAERFGMMAMVDRWVIRNTLALYRQYKAEEAEIRLAINLSADSLSDPSLWNFVSEQFLLTGVNPANITFEVTETGIIQNLDVAKAFIRSCRHAGSRIALDDFGTGQSSLSYLKQFALDIIKIDGEFIRTLLQNPLDQAIIRSVGDIARSVGATTVAECVEDAPTIEMLRSLQVDWIQGWATGRPMPLKAMLASAEQRATIQPPEAYVTQR